MPSRKKTVIDMFQDQVKIRPEQIAVRDRDRSLTYTELDQRAQQIAQRLLHTGLTGEKIVGLMVKRSADLFVGMLGILKAGGTYVPIDPEFPANRIKYLIKNSNSCILLTQRSIAEKGIFTEKIMLMDDQCSERPHDLMEMRTCPADLAYIIYTSGTTGDPKGVMISHRALSNFVQGLGQVIDFSAGKSILALTTVSFDIFVLESLLPLALGMTVIMADEMEQRNPKLLGERIIQSGVTMLQMTPSSLQLLLHHDPALSCLCGLTELMVGGEPFPLSLLTKVKACTPARIYNMYGPTEATVWASVSDLTEKEQVDIGRPIRNTQFYIFDEQGLLQPPGGEGELCIAGECLASGYYNNAELTNRQFIDNPFVPGTKMYRTGDFVRMSSAGELIYLGRKDHQVKIRGHRIELEEIEAHLLTMEGVQQAIVVVSGKQEESQQLSVVYVADTEIPVSAFRQHLVNILPDYMIPAYWVRVGEMPRTPNGKIDRQALSAVIVGSQGAHPGEYGRETKLTPMESKILEILQENLEIPMPVEMIHAHDPLASLGMDSINFIKVTVALELEWGIEFDDDHLIFANFPDIASLARYIEDHQDL